MREPCELTILMPCLNEAETISTCIGKAREFLRCNGVNGEVLVADNGSSDGSPDIAIRSGARVVSVETTGYGAALLGGIEAALGEYVIMGDADDSYDFTRLEGFLTRLREGFELVLGNRFLGGIMPGAMPRLHKYLGNPMLNKIGRLFFGSPVGDFHCGLRGFNKRAIKRLGLQTTGMEFASEMVIKATLFGLKITEVPTILSPDGRNRPSHLLSWRDGWRHLCLLLIYSPRWLFLYPGLTIILTGFALMVWLLPAVRYVGAIALDIHTLVFASGLIILGLQACLFAVFTKLFGTNLRLLPPDPLFQRLIHAFTLERGLVVGAVLAFCGFGGSVYATGQWEGAALGRQQPQELMRIVVLSLTSILVGMEIIFASFFLRVLQIKPPSVAHLTDD